MGTRHEFQSAELTPYGLRHRPSYAWRWRQVLSPVRVGGRLTAVAVDPRNANRIFVGTEEYRLLRSMDGGATWDELDLSPFVWSAREFRMRSPGLPRLGEVTPMGFFMFLDPPYRAEPANRIVVPGNIGLETFWNFRHGEVGSAVFGPRNSDVTGMIGRGRQAGGTRLPPVHGGAGRPADPGGAVEFIRPLNIVTTARPIRQLLDDAVRPQPTFTVRRVKICPGAAYPLLVATQQELLGSVDDGRTWVRLLRLPGTIQVNHVACGPHDQNLIIAATTFGPFISSDGGVSWDQDLSGWPGRDATAAAFDPRPGKVGEVLIATGADLFVGDPRSREGLAWKYPDFNNSATLPWQRINYVSMTGAGVVWLATDDGLRVSRDGGDNWNTVSRGLLARQKVELIGVGSSELNTERIAVVVRDCRAYFQGRPACRGSLVYATDDGGQSWFPFFDGMTASTVGQIASAAPSTGGPPRWWVLTSAGLYATLDPTSIHEWAIDRETQAWARARLLDTPPLNDTLAAVFEGTQMTEDGLVDATALNRRKHLAPELHLRATVDFARQSTGTTREVTEPFELDLVLDTLSVSAWAFLQWRLKDVTFYGTNFRDLDFPSARAKLWQLRKSIADIAGVTWHERRLTLHRLAEGVSDRLQTTLLRERVAALEAILETWMQQPMRRRLRLEAD